MLSIALLNQKGGVGKTAIAINLGAALAELGYRVLLIDLDPQGHLTEACSLAETQEPATLANALLMEGNTLTAEHVKALVTTWRENIDVVPTNLDAFKLERQLYRVRGAEYRLERVVELLAAGGGYDVCLIDCPPSLGVLTDNALVTAEQLIIPVQAEDSTLRALRLLLEQVTAVKTELRTDIDILGMVVNLYDRRKGQIVTSTLATLREMPLPILATIHDRAVIREAWRLGVSVLEHAPQSDATEAFRALAKHLVAA
ncbi:ParA family protein [Dactylosporangium sp. CA-152071]|uniref:ParA family protein n=1 Tax=Dactylosporangium sp. CA-152071 TaxID=3239933 RepID=UPI003D8F3418